MALGIGYEMEGFAIVVYRTNTELTQAIDFINSSQLVNGARAIPLVALPAPVESSSKGIDALKRIDWNILKSLSWNGRKSLGDIAADVGASVPTVRKRLEFMRKHGIIHETIQVNPAASNRGFVVMLKLKSSIIVQKDFYQIDLLFRQNFPEEYWVIYRAANEAEIMVVFVVESPKRVADIRHEILNVVEECQIEEQVIVPEWFFFPDFRDDMIDAHLKQK